MGEITDYMILLYQLFGLLVSFLISSATRSAAIQGISKAWINFRRKQSPSWGRRSTWRWTCLTDLLKYLNQFINHCSLASGHLFAFRCLAVGSVVCSCAKYQLISANWKPQFDCCACVRVEYSAQRFSVFVRQRSLSKVPQLNLR